MQGIYMDNAATSFPKPECVYQAVDFFNRQLGGSPGRGSHQRTLQAGSILLETREALAKLFGIAESNYIAFCLNITEAINTGLKGLLRSGDHVITTSMEHNAVARPLQVLAGQGITWTAVACAPDGTLDPEEVRKAIRPQTRLICMLHASNVTGTIMPIGEVGKLAREHGLLFMLDSAQTAGVLPIDVKAQHIDVLAFTGHKSLLGPQGTGGIYVRPGLRVRPLKEGGTGSLSEFLEQPEAMPDNLESGTPNTPGIAGLLDAVSFIQDRSLETIRSHEQKLSQMLISGLQGVKGIKLYGPCDPLRQTAVLSFNLEDWDCGELSFILEQHHGIITRSGLHCAPMAHRSLGTLRSGSCRISPGLFNTEEEVAQVIEALEQIARKK
ncbi:MAG TPA: aminotransferase class V-fold PLP-dependent enzyme [Syntrophomonadaceae bacterium]|nr:aminotransferase class V-fold PLP-dependent enzyme [Syntrophomonadaceae bacterium]